MRIYRILILVVLFPLTLLLAGPLPVAAVCTSPCVSVSASPTSLTIPTGSSGTSTVLDSTSIFFPFGGCATLTLSTGVSPAGPTATLDHYTDCLNSFSAPASHVLTVDATGTSAGTYTVTVTVCAPNGSNPCGFSNSATVTVSVADFTISGSPSSLTILTGSSTTSTINLNSFSGFADSVSLTASSVPSFSCGLRTCFLDLHLSPSSVPLASGGTGSSALTVSATGTYTVCIPILGCHTVTVPAPAGTYTVTVMGTSGPTTGSLVHSALLTVNVEDLTVSAGAVTPSQILAGGSGVSTITVTAVNGFTGTVNLSVSASTPGGLMCTLAASVALPPSPATTPLSCSATAPGDYTVTVTESSGTLSHTTDTIHFHVVDIFAVSADPTSVLVAAGGSGTSTITVAAQNGFSATVALIYTASSGLTGCVGPASAPSAAASFSMTLTLSVLVSSATCQVSGSANGLTHSVTVTVTVPDFIIDTDAVAPTQILAGGSGASTITVTSLRGLAGTVALLVSASTPAGLTCTVPTSVVVPPSPNTATLSCRATSPGDYTVTVTGSVGTLSHTTGAIVFHVVDFELVANAVSPAQILAGATGTSTITVTAVNGFTGTVTLTASSSTPVGLTCGAASVTLQSSPSTGTLSCSTTVAGDYKVTVTGASGTLSHTTASVLFRIVDFTISVGASTPTQILAGASGSSTITVTAANGFAGTVTPTVSTSAPAGLTCLPLDGVILQSSPSTSSLSCSASAAGDYTVTVTGTSGSLSHTTAAIFFHVVDFSISANPASPSIQIGNSGMSTITVAPINGFAGDVSLSVVSVSPSGPTATLSTSTIPGGSGSATLRVTLDGSVGSGSYTVTVKGASGTLSRSVQLTITVTSPPSPASNVPTILGLQPLAFYAIVGVVIIAIAVGSFLGLRARRPASPKT